MGLSATLSSPGCPCPEQGFWNWRISNVLSNANNSVSMILLAFPSEIQAKREKKPLSGQFKAEFKSNSAAQVSSLIMWNV